MHRPTDEPLSYPKTKSIWPTSYVSRPIARWNKVGVNRHFKASWTSQLTGCLSSIIVSCDCLFVIRILAYWSTAYACFLSVRLTLWTWNLWCWLTNETVDLIYFFTQSCLLLCVALDVVNHRNDSWCTAIELNKTGHALLIAKRWTESFPYVCQYHCKYRQYISRNRFTSQHALGVKKSSVDAIRNRQQEGLQRRLYSAP